MLGRMTSSAIRCTGLAYRYAAGSELRFPDVDIAQGATLLLRGASGAGKSTWLALVAGLLRPSQGQLMVAGQDLLALQNVAKDAWRARAEASLEGLGRAIEEQCTAWGLTPTKLKSTGSSSNPLTPATSVTEKVRAHASCTSTRAVAHGEIRPYATLIGPPDRRTRAPAIHRSAALPAA